MSKLMLWLGFLAMCIGLFMAILDIQVVASALTTIGAALHVAPARLGWIQTGYLMAEVIAIPLTGILTRALSLRWMAQFAATRRGTPMPKAIALELLEAYNGQGNVIKKRDDTHKMAQANKAFAHYAW